MLPLDRLRFVVTSHLIVRLLSFTLIMVPSTVPAETPLALEVMINGHPSGKIGEFVLRDGMLYASPAELRSLGFRIPATLSTVSDGLVALSAIPEFTWHLEQSTQILEVTAATRVLEPTILGKIPQNSAIPMKGDTGLTLDYAVNDTYVSHQNLGAGLFDLRTFSPLGVLNSGFLGYAGSGPHNDGNNSLIRLDTQYTYADVNSLRRYRLGDFISGSLGWSRPVRLGGAQISSDYSMRPDLITFPLPTVNGSAAVPSTADVLVNGTRQFSRDIQPGPFEIPHLPVVTGAGTVTVLLTDALGRQVVSTLPFYATPELLAPGLQTFSVDVGALRDKWGSVSNDYGILAGSGTWRRGISQAITLESHAEGTSKLVLAGGGLALNIADQAILNLAVAGSAVSQQTATQFTIGAQHIGQIFSIGASAQFAASQYQDIASQDGDPVARRRLTANTGMSLGSHGSIGLAYTGIDRDALLSTLPSFSTLNSIATTDPTLPAATSVTTPETNPVLSHNIETIPALHTRILSISYSAQIGRFSPYITAFHDLLESGDQGILTGISCPFWDRSSANISAGSTAQGETLTQLQAQQSATTIGDWGYRLYGDDGKIRHDFGELQYKSPWSLISAGIDQTGQQDPALRTAAQGAFTFADGGFFATNSIYDSFAIVDTEGMAGVHVRFENRDMGKTDSNGRLLVPELRSYDINRLAIEPTDVPADVYVSMADQEVRPPYRSGVVAKFSMHRSHAALVRLIDESGTPISVGSTAKLIAQGMDLPVGYDGEVFVQNLDSQNDLLVEEPSGHRCSTHFVYRPIAGEIPVIGPLTCREVIR